MKKNNNLYYTNRHSCFLLQYHLVLVTRYRNNVINGDLDDWLKKYTTQYFSDRDTKILSIETCGDHIHILFEAPPQINLADFVNAYKSASSRRIKAEFSEYLRPFYWKPYFWSLSYFIATVSERSTEAVKNYIANQKK